MENLVMPSEICATSAALKEKQGKKIPIFLVSEVKLPFKI